ncbi:MAG: hypothetical protein Q9157_008481, partial [Trypethelium eluteriae]
MADIDDIAKIDPDREGSSESIDSTPELETEGYQQEVPQPQKRKGGRKPIYATSEERKQRNRQAQAAFRERRTEYIKQLEHTIKQQEDSLQTLQQNHRTAADECLMLRYKNSLLERILLEKGIDVQAELRTKTGSPNLGPTPVPPSASGPPAQPPMQRALLNRHTQAQRNVAGLAPKLERPQIHTRQGVGVGATSNSPQQPTPSSHASSPSGVSVRSPGANPSGGVHSPTSIHLAQQQGQHPQPFRTHQSQTSQYQPLQPAISSSTSYTSPTVSSASGPGAANVVSGTGLYPSPFQNHYDQLGKLTLPLFHLMELCRPRVDPILTLLNLYELLGNDPEQDPEREPEPPTKAIDKPTSRPGKRNAGADAPIKETARSGGGGGGRGGRRDNFSGNEGAFRDRDVGRSNNRERAPDDGLRQDRHPDRLRDPNTHRDIDGRPRGSRGGRGFGGRGTRTARDDRHTRNPGTGTADHEKQASHGWGDATGEGELADELAGDRIAKQEEATGGWDTEDHPPLDDEGNVPDTATADERAAADNAENAAPAEPEINTKSLDDYMAEQMEKRAALGGPLAARQANEGGAGKFPEGKALKKDDAATGDFIAGSGPKSKRERERK